MGINITIDAFSGRPNPSWDIDDQDQVKDLVDLLVHDRHVLEKESGGPDRLGYRGVRVRITSDTVPSGLPSGFTVGSGGSFDPLTAADVAERLLDTMPVGAEWADAEDPPEGPVYTGEFQEWVRGEIRRYADRGFGRPGETEPGGAPKGEGDGRSSDGFADYRPDYWNTCGTRQNNNCYNYAVNLATGTFAQPGRFSGYRNRSPLTCADVVIGAFCDGLHAWEDPVPGGTRRSVVALATGDLGGQRDYHWYRLHKGFWAHKPGLGRVCNTDESGFLIMDPETCDRGAYADWCGYLQVDDLARIR